MGSVLGYVGGALILALVWVDPVRSVLPIPPIEIPTDSLWAKMGWWGLLIGLTLAVLFVYLATSRRRWAAWSSLVAGALMIVGGAVLLIVGFLWTAVGILVLAGACHSASGILRMVMKAA